MKPPIPAPWPEPEPKGPLTKRLEWNEAEQCFFLFYSSSPIQRLRCEWEMARLHPYLLFCFVVGFALALLILWATNSRANAVKRFCVFSWGVRDETSDFLSGEIRWSSVRKIANQDGDILILRKPIVKLSCYLVRESFITRDESSQLEMLLRSLWQSNGEQWSRLTAQYTQSKEVSDVYRI